MNNNRRRNFRGRPQKSNFRRRSSSNHGTNGHFSNNMGNKSYGRNGSLSNPSSIEKVISKYQQLAKDAQSSGDPVLIENYLQHAEHYSRKLAEINFKNQSTVSTSAKSDNVNTTPEVSEDKEI
tara:strand:- start:90 stop:458 length:369 start_codon:yes stop_codon:yes gene_type:complete